MQAECQAGRPKICTRICCALLLSTQKLDRDPICLYPLRNKAAKVKDTIKGSHTSLPLKPSLPLNSDASALMPAYWEAEGRETLQAIQNGRTRSVKGQLPAQVPSQSRLLGLAEVFLA